MTKTDQAIKSSTDYKKFKDIHGNRDVRPAHVANLVDAIKGDVDCIRYNPILVNENWEIINGQHRFDAIKELGLPVYYIQEKGLDLKNVQALNSNTRPWTPMDFALSFSNLGNKNYTTYVSFKKKYKINHDILMNFLSLDNPMTLDSFKNGKLKVEDAEKSHDLCTKLLDFAPLYERYKYRTFAFAFKQIWAHKEYDHARMLDKLKDAKLEHYAGIEDYTRALEKIYNHALPTQKKLRFF